MCTTVTTIRVGEAMDMIQEYVNQAIEPLEQVRIVAREARNIPDIPSHVDQSLLRIIGEIDRTIGGSQWEPVGKLKTNIQLIHESIGVSTACPGK